MTAGLYQKFTPANLHRHQPEELANKQDVVLNIQLTIRPIRPANIIDDAFNYRS